VASTPEAEPANPDAWLQVTPAAAELGVTVATLYRWMRNGTLPYTRNGKGRLIQRRALLEVPGRKQRQAADMDAAVERMVREAIESGLLPSNPPPSSLMRAARILRGEPYRADA